jgi:AcrR family transcriptional regulator
MTSPGPADPRSRLLAAAVDYLQQHGLGDLSLRELAAAIGTSHRMLIYHFGSKEGLLAAVVRAVEDEQRAFFAGLAADPALGPLEVAAAMWNHLADTRLWPSERLFFELYGQALQGRPGTEGFLDAVSVAEWMPQITGYRARFAPSAEDAEAEARLSAAVVRGLLLELVATGDRAAADRAFGRFIELARLALALPRGPG